MELLKGKHILFIVENLTVPFDRRVWQEANTLKEQGADVSIICPVMKGYLTRYELINGIHIYRHPLKEGNGLMAYISEYTQALFWEFCLSCKVYFRKPFQVIHGCNPPDLIFLIAFLFKILNVKFVFDHHDINPELYIAKFNKKGIMYKLLLLMERLTFATANFSIATNESYKKIAIERGKMPVDKIQVIRSGPQLGRLKIMEPTKSYKKGRSFLVGYVGVIGSQEGIDLLLESILYIVKKRNDIQFAIIGGGTDLEHVKNIAKELNLNEYVDFYGRIDDDTMLAILNTADVCVNPDTPTIMNNLSTMNKIMEYMALKKPIVQYDLKEGRFSAEGSSLYADTTTDFGEKILYLIDNPTVAKEMGLLGYNRIVNQLSWDYESVKLVKFYKKVLNIQ
jgi:glycosyltransferase involved in cell wall biosynthesis